MMQVFPSFFRVVEGSDVDGDGLFEQGDRQHVFAEGMGSWVWAAVFCIEHLLLLGAGLVATIVPSVPEWYVFFF